MTCSLPCTPRRMVPVPVEVAIPKRCQEDSRSGRRFRRQPVSTDKENALQRGNLNTLQVDKLSPRQGGMNDNVSCHPLTERSDCLVTSEGAQPRSKSPQVSPHSAPVPVWDWSHQLDPIEKMSNANGNKVSHLSDRRYSFSSIASTVTGSTSQSSSSVQSSQASLLRSEASQTPRGITVVRSRLSSGSESLMQRPNVSPSWQNREFPSHEQLGSGAFQDAIPPATCARSTQDDSGGSCSVVDPLKHAVDSVSTAETIMYAIKREASVHGERKHPDWCSWRCGGVDHEDECQKEFPLSAISRSVFGEIDEEAENQSQKSFETVALSSQCGSTESRQKCSPAFSFGVARGRTSSTNCQHIASRSVRRSASMNPVLQSAPERRRQSSNRSSSQSRRCSSRAKVIWEGALGRSASTSSAAKRGAAQPECMKNGHCTAAPSTLEVHSSSPAHQVDYAWKASLFEHKWEGERSAGRSVSPQQSSASGGWHGRRSYAAGGSEGIRSRSLSNGHRCRSSTASCSPSRPHARLQHVEEQMQSVEALVKEMFGARDERRGLHTTCEDSGARLRHMQEVVDATGAAHLCIRDPGSHPVRTPRGIQRKRPSRVHEVIGATGVSHNFISDQDSLRATPVPSRLTVQRGRAARELIDPKGSVQKCMH